LLFGNLYVVKHLVNKEFVNFKEPISLNAYYVSNDYLNETRRKSENKDSYSTIYCPVIILAAISGNVEMIKYLSTLGVDIHVFGQIALSKKKKNSVISNIIGACAYYGRHELLKYLLENFKGKYLLFNQSFRTARR